MSPPPPPPPPPTASTGEAATSTANPPNPIPTPSTTTSKSTTTSTTAPLSILFVCLGNICRSPMAEGVFRSLINPPSSSSSAHFATIDSAGTGAYHTHSPPDRRTISVLSAHGIRSYTHAARKVTYEDFAAFDFIFAMDQENLVDLREMREVAGRRTKGRLRGTRKDEGREEEGGRKGARVMLYGAFGGKDVDEEVVDPYYGGNKGFEIAFEQVERFGRGFLKWLEEEEGKKASGGSKSEAG